MAFDIQVVARVLQDLRDQLQREANQSILRRDHSQGLAALGGLDALQRFESRLSLACPELRFAAKIEATQPHRQDKVSPLRGKRGA